MQGNVKNIYLLIAEEFGKCVHVTILNDFQIDLLKMVYVYMRTIYC